MDIVAIDISSDGLTGSATLRPDPMTASVLAGDVVKVESTIPFKRQQIQDAVTCFLAPVCSALSTELNGLSSQNITERVRSFFRGARPASIQQRPVETVFFSGGVDSMDAAASVTPKRLATAMHFDRHPDETSPNEMDSLWNLTVECANALCAQPVRVSSNIRSLVVEHKLNKYFEGRASWWHGAAHTSYLAGFGHLIGTTPGFSIGIASSDSTYSQLLGSTGTDQSYLDAFATVKAPLQFIDPSHTRQEKLARLLSRRPELLLRLRTCYQSSSPKCAKCTKCTMTAAGLWALGFDPVRAGFPSPIHSAVASYFAAYANGEASEGARYFISDILRKTPPSQGALNGEPRSAFLAARARYDAHGREEQ